jgi:hypothetical protein
MLNSTVLIIAFICLAIGYIAGVIVFSISANRQRDAGEEEIDTRPEGLEEAAPIETLSKDHTILSRDNRENTLEVMLNGVKITQVSLLNSAQLNSLQNLAVDFQKWIADKTVGPSVSDRPVDVLPQIGKPAEAPDLKKPGAKKEAAPNKPAPSGPKSIVQQVDEILQQQITGTPLESKGIKLSDNLSDGVSVWIGLQQFKGIDSVPDQEVIDAIRNAVRTWEGKTS